MTESELILVQDDKAYLVMGRIEVTPHQQIHQQTPGRPVISGLAEHNLSFTFLDQLSLNVEQPFKVLGLPQEFLMQTISTPPVRGLIYHVLGTGTASAISPPGYPEDIVFLDSPR